MQFLRLQPEEQDEEWEAADGGGFTLIKDAVEVEADNGNKGTGVPLEADVDKTNELGWYVLFGGPEEGVHSAAVGGPEARRLFEVGEEGEVDFLGFGKGPAAENRARKQYESMCEGRRVANLQK